MNDLDSTSPHGAYYTIAPNNFRNVIQRQIQHTIGKEVEGITDFSRNGGDGRFSNTNPSETIYMSNSDGFHYFVVGISRVGFGAVAAP